MLRRQPVRAADVGVHAGRYPRFAFRPGIRVGYRSVLRNRRFVLYLGMTAADNVGYSLSIVAVLWLAYQSSHNLLAASVVLFLQSAVYASTFLFGPLVDRARDKRTVFAVSYGVQAAAAVGLAASNALGLLTLPLLFALVAAISVAQDFSWAGTNVAPRLLLSPDEMFAAQGLSGAVTGANAVAGYAVGATLLVVAGVEGSLVAYAVLLVLATLLALPLSIRAPAVEREPFLRSFRDGWRRLADGPSKPLLQLLAVDTVRGFWINAPALLITLLANAVFPDAALSYGALFVAYVVGEVSADLLLGRWNPRHLVGGILLATLFGTGLLLGVAVALPPVLLLAGLAWFAVGFAVEAYYDAKYSYLRGAVPPEALGRVTANLYLFPGILSAVGAVAIGALAEALPPATLGGVVAAGFLAAALLGTALPGFRRLRY
jgi:MFS family permease